MKIRFKDVIDPRRWKAFLVFLLKKALRLLGDDAPYMEKHEIEQLGIRVFDDNCSKCLENGNCLHCGCHTEGRMNGWKDSCSAGHWGPVMSKEDWNKYKQQYNVKCKVSYGE